MAATAQYSTLTPKPPLEPKGPPQPRAAQHHRAKTAGQLTIKGRSGGAEEGRGRRKKGLAG